MNQITKEAKELLIGISIFFLIILGVFISVKVYQKKIAKLTTEIESLESELLKNKIGRDILFEGLKVAEHNSDSLKNELDILLKHKPIITHKQNAPINYNTAPTIVDSIYQRNYNRFK